MVSFGEIILVGPAHSYNTQDTAGNLDNPGNGLIHTGLLYKSQGDHQSFQVPPASFTPCQQYGSKWPCSPTYHLDKNGSFLLHYSQHYPSGLPSAIFHTSSNTFALAYQLPHVSTTCLAPVAAYLCFQGITIFPYLDDWLLVAPS